MSIEPKNNSFQPKQMCFDPSLHTAVSKKNYADCYRLIESRADVNARDSWGWTPLHTAVHERWPAGYHLLMDSGADVNATGAHDVASLSIALRAQSLGVVRSLVGGNFSVEKPNGWSPLQLAIRDGNPEIVRFLIEHGAKVEPQDKPALSSLLRIAIRDQRFETVRCLIENGAILSDSEKRELGSLLPTVISHGCLEMVRFLLEQGVPPIRNGLAIAISMDHPEMIRYLISTGFWTKDWFCLRELLLTAKGNAHHAIVCCLVKHGADVAAILEMAIAIHSIDMVRCLIDDGVDASILGAALKTDVKAKHFDIARHLVDAGASPDEETLNAIKEYFLAKEANKKMHVRDFFLRRPKCCALEVFENGRFRPLSANSDLVFIKPVALINIAAYEQIGPNYGIIANYLRSSRISMYKKMAQEFTVVRVLVDNPNQLVSVVLKVRNALPTLPILYWGLAGHGNGRAVGLGDGLRFQSTDTLIMQMLSELVHPEGIFALWGCENAKGDSNIVEEFSKNAPKQIVHGSTEDVYDCIPICIRSKTCKTPLLLTTFTDSNESESNRRLRAYKGGKEVVDGLSPRSRF
jgi:hypothetical protein